MMKTCELKKLYIPQCVKGDVSISQAARLIGCTRQTVINLKKKFRDIGEKAFIHGSKGRRNSSSRKTPKSVFLKTSALNVSIPASSTTLF